MGKKVKIETRKIEVDLIQWVEKITKKGMLPGLRLYYFTGDKEEIVMKNETAQSKIYKRINHLIDKRG